MLQSFCESTSGIANWWIISSERYEGNAFSHISLLRHPGDLRGMFLFLYFERACVAWMIPGLCSYACVLYSPRELKWFPDVSSGVLLRAEGAFALVVIGFVRLPQLIWKSSVIRFPTDVETELWAGSLSVLSFNCDIFMKVVLSDICINVLKVETPGCFMNFDMASVKLLFIIQNKTPVYDFTWCGWLNNVIEMASFSPISLQYWQYSIWTMFRRLFLALKRYFFK